MTLPKFGPGADAYLEWGLHVGFKGFGDVFPDKSGLQVGLLVEWANTLPQRNDLPAEIDIADIYLSEKFATLTVDAAWLATEPAKAFFAKFVARCELATPVVPYPANDIKYDPLGYENWEIHKAAWQPKSDLLLACIDDAFPIASRRFFKGNASRVLRIWDQQRCDPDNPTWAWLSLDDSKVGLPGANFTYGAELINSKGFTFAKPAVKPHISAIGVKNIVAGGVPVFVIGQTQSQLTKQVTGIPTVADAADDQNYYQRAGLPRMRHRVSHGAHALDVMAGPTPARSRISPSRDLYGGGDGSSASAPTWAAADDAASKADLVLVQLPDYAINDPSGRWLARNVLDGLHYVVKSAGPAPKAGGKVKKVVVNLSWGPQTGPHDGSSLLEAAIDALVVKESKVDRELAVVLPAGNSFSSRAHAQFAASSGCNNLVWCIPPGALTPAFLEVWWPEHADDAKATYCITVTPPVGNPLTLSSTGTVAAANKIWGITGVVHGKRRMALLTLGPTFSHVPGTNTAPHGRWLITVSAVKVETGDVHIYVARADHNMGAKRKSAPSYLFDPHYESMRRSRTGKFAADPAGSLVKRDSTLNGLATGQKTLVAGGYRLADQHTSWYSSSGPSAARVGPDCVYPCDDSVALFGIKAGAVRDGAVTRLIGTSAAAPQLARDIAGMPFNVALISSSRAGPPHKRKGLGRR